MADTWISVAEGVYYRTCSGFSTNVGLVVGAEAALVVDTRSSAREGREMLAEVQALAPVPVRHVVNTHFHFDHCFGNEAFLPAAIWGHRLCASRMLQEGEAEKAMVVKALPDRAEVTITPPTRLVDTRAEIDLGGRTVVLWHPGVGHTDHDLVVDIPDADVTFTGDLLEEGMAPAFGDSWPAQWPSALDRLLRSALGTIIPGHGKQVSRSFVEAARDDLSTVVDLFRTADDRAEIIARSPFPRDHTLVALHRFLATTEGKGS
ncbi:MBL fold metallo-hydrolase [Allokutzneria albata]|uniref:Glyoxylase, beta-lactamase superfamily II n=1 Tax=Allokutzneria albata TaxID=211114 RepID=A0A1G9U0L9_ALLAB|nr:MBL fold metallo-hydrolase [Allokutzneria albata]SDM53204.1 Glyoxylase, beta-lactamase superfamily II [Allokutzneria albata]